MKKILAFSLSLALLMFPLVSLAACGTGGNSTSLCNPLGYNSLVEFLRRILELVTQIGYPVIVLFIVYIGFLYIQSSGNADKLKKVHEYFFWALVGSLIVLGAQALALAIQATVEQLKAGV